MAYTEFRNGFNVTSTNTAIDKRIYLSFTEMLTAEDDYNLPDRYFAIGKEDGRIYLFNKYNSALDTTGKFRKLSYADLADQISFVSGTPNVSVTKLGSVYTLSVSDDRVISWSELDGNPEDSVSLVEFLNDKFVLKVNGKDLSTNDFSDEYKNKLESVDQGAQKNIIETININGIDKIPSGKTVSFNIPTGDAAYKNVDNTVGSDSTELPTSRAVFNFIKSEGYVHESDITNGISSHNSSAAAHNDIRVELLNKYTKPSTGIVISDLSANIIESLNKADTALQSHQSLAAYSLITDTGSKIDLELQDNYKLYAKLYDKSDNLISVSSEIDLPLEEMIVNVSYNAESKELIFTLKSGSYVTVPVGDIISGLATEGFVTSKIATEDTNLKNWADGKFLTEHQDISGKANVSYVNTEISRVEGRIPSLAAYRTSDAQDIIDSGKQNVIGDLDAIRAGAALGATAIQAHQDISGKQDMLIAGNNIAIDENNVISVVNGVPISPSTGTYVLKAVNGVVSWGTAYNGEVA